MSLCPAVTGGFGDQISWLQADLKAAVLNRDNVPWIIVGGHRPMYSTAAQTLDNLIWVNATLHLRQQVEDMFHTYGVDLYLCGCVNGLPRCDTLLGHLTVDACPWGCAACSHVHGYERMWPVYHNQTTQKSYVNPPIFTHLVSVC